MKRLLLVSALALGAALLPRSARAQGMDQDTLTVTATVLGLCTIEPATLEFGNYDPGAGTYDGLGSGNIRVNCTSGTDYWIGLGLGSNASGATRRMAGGSGEFLSYELYRDGARTQVWDDTLAGSPGWQNANNAAAGLSSYDTTVYGSILAGPPVSTGDYADTVTMTVNF